MSLRRFMINSSCLCDGYAVLEGEVFNHIVRVLRLGPGESLQLADEKGAVHSGVIDQVTKKSVRITLLSSQAAVESHSAAPRITICQALPKGDRIDLILQKCTELGAHDFWLFGGRRSVAKVREEQQTAKLDRWNRITSEAARQCGRNDIPQVSWRPNALDAASAAGQQLRLILWEDEREKSLKQTLSAHEKPASVIVAIGPEGGFDPLEVKHFSQNGFQPVSLGSRILRTETAGIAIMAVMQYIWDGM
ncbi:MAG: 16S rRNA (uracil(1498)-N(3))-methyltransferase [Steroidobacteraceae bacterium]|nr:16S rRNA (uracil(1498)-N(3))-methyltransferase [Deltaproteobacteria bacterium]